MISSKAETIKNRIVEFCTLILLEYNGKEYSIDPFAPDDFHINCAGNEFDLHSIDEVMNKPMFDGKALAEIADDITIVDW